MAENDTPDLEILLRIAADTAGEEKVRAALRGVTEEARVGGEEQVKSNVKTGESFHLPHDRGREFHRLLHQLTEQSPLLGIALRAAFSPTGAIISGGIIAAHMLTEEFKKLSEALKLPEYKNAEEAWKAQSESLFNASTASEQFALHLLDVAKSERDVKRDTDEAIAAIKRQANAQKEIKDAEEALALARIDAQEKLGVDKGGLSEVAAAEARLKVQKDFAEKRASIQRKAGEDEILAVQGAQLRLNQVQMDLEIKLAQDREQQAQTQSEAYLKAMLRRQDETTAALQASLKEKRAQLAVSEDKFLEAALPGPVTTALRRGIEMEQQQLELSKERRAKLEEILPARIAEATHAEETVKADQQKIEKAITLRQELERQVILRRQEFEEATALSSKLDEIKGKTRETQAAPTFEKGAEAVAARTREIEEQFRKSGIGVGRQTGHEIGTALDEALKEFGVGVTDALVPRIQSVIDRAKKDMRAEFDAKLGFAKTGK